MDAQEIKEKKKELAKEIIVLAKMQGTYTGLSAEKIADAHSLNELRLRLQRMKR